MKTVILYYTYGGSAKKEAERLCKELNAPLYRIKEAKKRSMINAFLSGCYKAMQRKTTAICTPDVDLNEFDRIYIGCPVWAGYPAPAFNAIVSLLPSGKEVELFFCSGGGETPKSIQGTKEMVEKRGCKVISYRDIATHALPGRLKE